MHLLFVCLILCFICVRQDFFVSSESKELDCSDIDDACQAEFSTWYSSFIATTSGLSSLLLGSVGLEDMCPYHEDLRLFPFLSYFVYEEVW